MRDIRVIALDQLGQCGAFRIWRVTALHNHAWGMLFRRIELRKARSLNARLPIVATRCNLLLFHPVLHHPYFRSVIVGSVSNDHNLENGVIRREIDFVMELGDKWAKLLEISDADGLQIRFALAGRRLVTGVSS